MKQRILFLIMTVLLTGAACTRENSRTPNQAYLSALAALDWGDSPCYVIGHKSPDTDAVCAAIAYARLMQALGYPCEARISGPVNRETRFIAERWDIPVPEILSAVEPGTRLILVDHAEYVQSPDGAPRARILQVIDHHGLGDITEPNLLYYKAMPLGSTCTIVYDAYQELGVPLSDETARVLLAGLVSDTNLLKKKTTTAVDTLVCSALAARLGYTEDELKETYAGMTEASKDISGMSDREIFLSYYKNYKLEGVRLGISSLESSGGADTDAFLERMLAVMPDIAQENDCTLLFAKFSRNKSTYILYSGEGAKEVAEQAFGPSLREGVCFVDRKLNRKTEIVPMITAALQALK